MKKILIVSPYYNNPHFIEYQINSFNKKIKEPYDFIILDDAEKDTKCLLKDSNASIEIQKECKRFNIKYIKVDTEIHKREYADIGVREMFKIKTPRIGGASYCHGRVLNWFMKNILTEDYYKKYKTMLIIDADVFILKNMSLDNVLKNHSVCSPRPTPNHGYIYPDVGFLLINMEIIPYEHIIEMNFLLLLPINKKFFDTGSKLHIFFDKYLKYKNNMKFLEGKLLEDKCPGLYHVYCGSKHNPNGYNYDMKMTKLKKILRQYNII